MLSKTTLLTLLTTTSLTAARLTGIAAPSTLAPSQPFTLTLLTENYIQSVADISVVWGFAPTPGFPLSLGAFVSSAYLGPSKSNQLQNVTIPATAPADLAQWKGKQVVLSASLFSLYGVSGTPSVANFNVTVNVGDQTSGSVKRSDGFTWGTGQC